MFAQPELFGTARRGAREGETEVLVLRSKVLLTVSEKDHMRRIANRHSLMRYEYQDPTSHYMLRCPMAGCRYGVLNQRNSKQAARAHFREFHKDGSVYNIKIEAKHGFNHVAFPEIKDNSGTAPRPRVKGRGKGGKKGKT